jgi:hypothetical protein
MRRRMQTMQAEGNLVEREVSRGKGEKRDGSGRY